MGSGKSKGNFSTRGPVPRRALAVTMGKIPELLAVLPDADVARQLRLRRHLDRQIAARNNLAGQDVSAEDFIAGEVLGRFAFTSPSRTITRHLPQTPSPPQIAPT